MLLVASAEAHSDSVILMYTCLHHSPVVMGPYDMDYPDPEDHYQGRITCPVCKSSISVSVSSTVKRSMLQSKQREDHDL